MATGKGTLDAWFVKKDTPKAPTTPPVAFEALSKSKKETVKKETKEAKRKEVGQPDQKEVDDDSAMHVVHEFESYDVLDPAHPNLKPSTTFRIGQNRGEFRASLLNLTSQVRLILAQRLFPKALQPA